MICAIRVRIVKNYTGIQDFIFKDRLSKQFKIRSHTNEKAPHFVNLKSRIGYNQTTEQ